MIRNKAIYPWYMFVRSLVFWQAIWFLYFEARLSPAEAILMYVIYDLSTTALEVPSGYMSDRLGRRLTLITGGISAVFAALLFVFGDSFALFALANVLLGAAAAFASGTDSSLLYESLNAEGQADQIESAELKAWRFMFVASALSALAGGALAFYGYTLAYVASLIAALATLGLSAMFKEPPHAPRSSNRENLRVLAQNFANPTLLWILCLSLGLYVFSHIPFVFGQPFIREALTAAGFASQAPLVSGSVTFMMMLMSVLTSLFALRLRNRIGLTRILLLAFGMQIALTAALASSNGLFVLVLLFFRMVPDSLSQPFIKARVQPLLQDGTRATFMSMQSLAGRILFAVTLSLAAAQTENGAPLPYSDIQTILIAYVGLGSLLILTLILTARRARI